MIDNCQIISEDSCGITVVIDLYENTLLENITKKFFIKKISTRKVEQRVSVLVIHF